jgi:hypothetical protein
MTMLPILCASVASLVSFGSQERGPAQSLPVRHLALLEHGPSWPSSGMPDMAKLGEHGQYMQRLFLDGRVLLGGPATDLSCGIVVFASSDRAEVERILAEDPAVKAGLFTPEIRAFHCASAADLVPASTLPPAPAGLEPLRLEITVPASLGRGVARLVHVRGRERVLRAEGRDRARAAGQARRPVVPGQSAGLARRRGAARARFVPERMLAFEWNAPPQFARARPERTFVVVELEPLAARSTRVVLVHQGFAEQAARKPELADEWKQVRAYFDQAWPTVLAKLEQRFTSGPVEWGKPAPAAASR